MSCYFSKKHDNSQLCGYDNEKITDLTEWPIMSWILTEPWMGNEWNGSYVDHCSGKTPVVHQSKGPSRSGSWHF